MRPWHRLIVMVIIIALLCLAPPALLAVRAQAGAVLAGRVVRIDAPGGLIVTRSGALSAAGEDLVAPGTGTAVQETTPESSSGAESSQRPSWLIICPVGLLILITVSGAALAQAIIVQARQREE